MDLTDANNFYFDSSDEPGAFELRNFLFCFQEMFLRTFFFHLCTAVYASPQKLVRPFVGANSSLLTQVVLGRTVAEAAQKAVQHVRLELLSPAELKQVESDNDEDKLISVGTICLTTWTTNKNDLPSSSFIPILQSVASIVTHSANLESSW